MSSDYSPFEQRKQDHIELALMAENQTQHLNSFDTIHLSHEALPNLNFSDISLQTIRLNQVRTSPFIVSSMTAGHARAEFINNNLMHACAQSGWSMGVGSQRRELTDENAALEWRNLRTIYPNVSVLSNLGIAQLITTPMDSIKRLIANIHAEALIIHCNPLQEVIQPEGTTDFKGCWQALERLVAARIVPIIVKETGCGFSKKTLVRLNDLGIDAVEISGLGGTHWGRIEGHRAVHDAIRQQTAHTFCNWGIDTVKSVQYAMAIKPCFEVWGSGGVRNGLDAAKLLALGAQSVGFAKPLLTAALESPAAVLHQMNLIEHELKTAMFCTGSQTCADLKDTLCL